MIRILAYFLIVTFLMATSPWCKIYKFEYQKQIDISRKAVLDISNQTGSINITGGTDNTIKIKAVKYVRAESRDEAEKLGEYIEIKARQDAGRVKIQTKHHKLPGRSDTFWEKLFGKDDESFGSVDYEIEVPAKCRIEVDSRSGKATLKNIKDDITVTITSGEVFLEAITGDLDIESTSGIINISDSKGDIIISAAGSDITLSHIVGSVDLKTTSGDKKGEFISGFVTILQTSGKIVLQNLDGGLRIKSSSGEIEIAQNHGALSIITRSGNVDISTALDSDDDYYIETASGDIHFLIPDRASARISLETNTGDISANLPMTIRSFSKSRIIGSIGEGGPKITLLSSSGDIELGQF